MPNPHSGNPEGGLSGASPVKPQADQLLDLVYNQLRAIAQEMMVKEKKGHTLEATALVHEAYVRLVIGRQNPWGGREHFLRDAVEAMKRILVEHARKRNAVKRGGNYRRKALSSVLDLAAEDEDPETQLALIEEFERFQEKSDYAEEADVFKLRFYAGLSVEQTAKELRISERTVVRSWKFVRAYLATRLGIAGGNASNS